MLKFANKKNFGRGFTLVELLVVISIIAMLLAILMPSLSKVREQARSLICKSTLKQYGLAAATYASSYNGYLVGGGNGDYMPKPFWTDALISFGSIPKDKSYFMPMKGFQCPSNKLAWRGLTYGIPVGSRSFYGKAAGGWMGLYGSKTPPELTRTNEIKRPSRVPHMTEMLGWTGEYNVNYASPSAPRNYGHVWNLYTDAHSKKESNVLYIDGHVESRSKNLWFEKGPTPHPWAYQFSINYPKP